MLNEGKSDQIGMDGDEIERLQVFGAKRRQVQDRVGKIESLFWAKPDAFAARREKVWAHISRK